MPLRIFQHLETTPQDIISRRAAVLPPDKPHRLFIARYPADEAYSLDKSEHREDAKKMHSDNHKGETKSPITLQALDTVVALMSNRAGVPPTHAHGPVGGGRSSSHDRLHR